MEVEQSIDLYTVYKRGKIIPIAFKWKQDKFLINKVNMHYTEKKGQFRIEHFAVSIDDTLYRISIDGRDNTCKLHSIEVD